MTRPFVSIVIPTFRRPALLARCLHALHKQRLPLQDFEVIVADDDNAKRPGPRAPAAQTVAMVAARYPKMTLRYVKVEDQHGPAAARNAGWRASRGDLIAFTDDDTVPDAGWLSQGMRAFVDPAVAAASGRVVVPLPLKPTDYEFNESRLEDTEFVTANCFVRRSVLQAIGGFDENFKAAWREDSDLHFRLLDYCDAHGMRLVRLESAIVVHPVRPAPWGVSLSQQRKAAFNALLYKKHPRFYRMKIEHAPPWRYYATVAAFAVGVAGLTVGGLAAAGLGFALWGFMTARFCQKRLTHTTRSARHVCEMIVTSALIPPLSIFWRLRGAVRYRVAFL